MLRIVRDMIVEIKIKLKIFGITLSGPANLFYDNNGVVNNTSIPGSTPYKNHNAIKHHCVHESDSVDVILHAGEEYTATNLSNPLTKLIPCFRKKNLFYVLFTDIEGG